MRFIDQGATWAETPKDVAASCDTVLTVLPSPAAVSRVVEGDDGLLEGFTGGETWIDISTTDRRETQRLAALCAERGIHMLEAPMTGGIPLAHQGQMTILVGGDEEIFQQCLPVLEAIGGRIIHLGPLGSAAVAKVVTNMLAAIHLWALGEGLMLGSRAGLDVGGLFEAIKASCGSSYVAETEGDVIMDGSYDYGFTFALQAKDAHLSSELGHETGVPLLMGDLVRDLIDRARITYGDEAWSTGLVRLLEDELGVTLRAEGYRGPEIDR